MFPPWKKLTAVCQAKRSGQACFGKARDAHLNNFTPSEPTAIEGQLRPNFQGSLKSFKFHDDRPNGPIDIYIYIYTQYTDCSC